MSGLLDYLRQPDSFFGVADLFFAGVLLYGILRGAFRGVSGEISATLGTLITFIGAWKFHQPVSAFLLEHTRLENELATRGLSYVLMVLLFLFVWKLITFLLRKVFEKAVPDHIERPAGAFLGLVKCSLVLCVLLGAVHLSGSTYLRENLIERSAFGRVTQVMIPSVLNRWLPRVFPAETPIQPTPVPDGSGNP